ncbi:MAG: tRNA pseudouridine(55) synthase TruB [Rhodanobacteraceae bacterium]
MPDRRRLTGILLLDKPSGMTSNRALQIAKRLYRADKAGHTGSLDPLATGLLPICFGEATKIAGYLLGARKAYAAECKLGVVTATDDAEGVVIRERAVPPLDEKKIRAQLAALTGRITQIPPVYSALKQQGVALYKRARRGEDVQVPPREVDVYTFDLLESDGDRLRLHVECGSGTYVRALVRDLGETLGCGAHLTALRRLWIEPFTQPRMVTLEELERLRAEGDDDALDTLPLPIEAGLTEWPVLELNLDDAQAVGHGRRIQVNATPGRYQVLNQDCRLLALAEVDGLGQLQILRGFAGH